MKTSVKLKLVQTTILLLVLAGTVVVPISGAFKHSHAAQPAAQTISPVLLATRDELAGGGVSNNGDPAVAVAFCAGYDLQNISFHTPLPSHPLQTTVGCDRELFPGQSTSIDYNGSNASDFTAFVNHITNGIDEKFWTYAVGVDNAGLVVLPAGGGSQSESSLSVNFPLNKPDLAGFTIDFVRLIVKQLEITLTSTNVNVTYSITWQIWGIPPHSNTAPMSETPMPTARYGLVTVIGPDGRIYAIGGGTLTSTFNTVEAYTASTNSWTCCLAPIPTARRDMAAALGPDGRIYVIGGSDNNGNALNTVEAYNTRTNSWTSGLAPMPTARYFLVAAEGPDGRIYAIGGQDTNGNTLKTVEAYNTRTNTWTTMTPLPAALTAPAVALGPDGRIYVIGGFNGSSQLNTVEAYSVSTNSWMTESPMPTARDGLAAAEGPDGRIYAIGGGANGGYLSTVEAYTASTNSWTCCLTPMPTPRGGLAAALGPNGRIYAIGGLNGSGELSTVEAYTP